jgi:hypothetical protein
MARFQGILNVLELYFSTGVREVIARYSDLTSEERTIQLLQRGDIWLSNFDLTEAERAIVLPHFGDVQLSNYNFPAALGVRIHMNQENTITISDGSHRRGRNYQKTTRSDALYKHPCLAGRRSKY